MNRRAETFFDAITFLREDLVEEAQDYVFRRRRSGWRKFGSLAACVMLVMSLGLLAVMPKGCGSAGDMVSCDMNTSSGAPASPAEAPPASGEPSDGSVGGSGTDTAPHPPEGEGNPDFGLGEDGPVQFSARVVEVLEDGLLAELLPEEPGLFGTDRVRISTAGLDGLPALQPGDVVFVSCGAASLEDGEILAEDVTELRLAEPDGP